MKVRRCPHGTAESVKERPVHVASATTKSKEAALYDRRGNFTSGLVEKLSLGRESLILQGRRRCGKILSAFALDAEKKIISVRTRLESGTIPAHCLFRHLASEASRPAIYSPCSARIFPASYSFARLCRYAVTIANHLARVKVKDKRTSTRGRKEYCAKAVETKSVSSPQKAKNVYQLGRFCRR